MSDSSKPDFEPTASNAPVPVGFIVAFVVLFYLSTLYLDGNAGGFDAKVYEPFTSVSYTHLTLPTIYSV